MTDYAQLSLIVEIVLSAFLVGSFIALMRYFFH